MHSETNKKWSAIQKQETSNMMQTSYVHNEDGGRMKMEASNEWRIKKYTDVKLTHPHLGERSQ